MKLRFIIWTLVFCIFAGCTSLRQAFAAELPQKPTGYVTDAAHVLSDTARQAIEASITTYEQQTTNEIAVVTIDTLPSDQTIEEVANALFRRWGIGKKDKNNGVLFILAIQDHKMRIEVGYGLEGDLTDIETKTIQDDFVRPFLQKSNYDIGIRVGIEEIQKGIGGTIAYGTEDSDPTYQTATPADNKATASGILGFFGWIIFIVFGGLLTRTIGYFLGRSHSWWLGGVLGALLGGIALLIWHDRFGSFWPIPIVILTGIGTITDYLASRNFKKGDTWWKYIKRGGGSSGSGSSWSSSGSSSSSSFGGGSSGGGGSSSSW